jgi:hypothetical protein
MVLETNNYRDWQILSLHYVYILCILGKRRAIIIWKTFYFIDLPIPFFKISYIALDLKQELTR